MEINGIPINAETIIKAIEYNYPNGLINPSAIRNNNVYDYLFLFGIRVSTCDTSLPDDAIGGIRLKKGFLGGNKWEILLSNATTDPSPFYLTNAHDKGDPAKYGTAWVKEGQYKYKLREGLWNDYPAFNPITPIDVYRWKPTQQQIDDARAKKVSLSSEFEKAKQEGKVTLGKAPDTLIHRTWGTAKLFNESAGCQVFTDNKSLIEISKWAKKHIELFSKTIKNPNSFVYTLLTKDDFIKANGNSEVPYLDVLNFKF